MAFFPDVSRGDPFKPNVLLSNNVRHMINSLDGFRAGKFWHSSNVIRVQVYNRSGRKIPGGCAVNFLYVNTPSEPEETMIPVEEYCDKSRPWGVLVNTLDPDETGSCIICGSVAVRLSGKGYYALPSVDDPSCFTCGKEGVPVIFSNARGSGLVVLGGSLLSGSSSYDGPFAVKIDETDGKVHVNGGRCIINVTSFALEEMILPSAGEGYVILTSSYDNGNITTPEITFATSYPEAEFKKVGFAIAQIHVAEEQKRITQLHYGDIHTIMWGDCSEIEKE